MFNGRSYPAVTDVIVDADACPVKEEVAEIAADFNIPVVYVASYNHFSINRSGNWVYVDTMKEAADMKIVNLAKRTTLVITQDIGLASLLLAKAALVINQYGVIYDENTIDGSLERRYLAAKQRRQGVHSKGPKAFTFENRLDFKKRFVSYLETME
ncbi:YaiI/YqxD family protein [Brochothrix thermosphacta]|uniref:YaiI/YqxD family protein n=1 Tax=Brochothrix thermosphacta TaxID=2756 RepID=UPI000E72C5B2|nr:DUF188 domain-containing protein [Brochothrix thermosphacta]ANZ94229.1 hypothetical protein BFC19_01665 [Brochothrix thermosphacta]WKK69870.1 DUF188 domain-containing protein [Brochothrix thermosphacta]